ncbi:hypothetical protein JYU34_009432 [Plutella xylostella]|uniref:Uncharacterized protein n=1 Tax=Plutella xylostella TaxID=51655 RepID=A0ABQ7QJF8_PLUXY|nr:hypothetical protein JYU34_009432 [Plutella xylostella]
METFLDTITLRRRRRTRTVSNDTVENAENSNLSLNGTTNSMPLISDDEDDQIKTLKDQIESLTIELRTAHEEISTLNLENTELKGNIEKLKKDNDIMKKVTNSLKSDITTPNKRKINNTEGSLKKSNSSTVSKKKGKKKSDNMSSPMSCGDPLETPRDSHLKKLDAQTQTSISSPIPAKTNPESERSLKAHKHAKSTTGQPPKSIKQDNKKKVLIISANKTNNILQIGEEKLGPNYKICHNLNTNAGIRELFKDLAENTKNLTRKDVCIVMIGEEDFKKTSDYFELVLLIRNATRHIENTNILICMPTYKYNGYKTMYNWRVETFNNLLYLDVSTHEHVFLMDSNENIKYSFDMFSQQGCVNNVGMNVVFDDIVHSLNKIMDITNNFDNSSPVNNLFR